jgi:hypothetical protein
MSSSEDCPTAICGVWQQDKSKCESLCAFLAGLGMPAALQYVACPIADNTTVTLRISCPEPGSLEIVDKTAFGRNATRVPTDGSETEKFTKAYVLASNPLGLGHGSPRGLRSSLTCGRRKVPYMLSATTSPDRAVLHCRLVSRGPGWHTRQERYLSDESDANGAPMLVERHVLVRPEQPDVVITRHFTRTGDEDLRPSAG